MIFTISARALRRYTKMHAHTCQAADHDYFKDRMIDQTIPWYAKHAADHDYY